MQKNKNYSPGLSQSVLSGLKARCAYRRAPLPAATVVGVIGIVICLVIGLKLHPIAVVLVILAVVLAIEGMQTIFGGKKKNA